MGWGEEVGREAVKYYIALNVGKVLLQSIRKLALIFTTLHSVFQFIYQTVSVLVVV